MSYLGSTLPPGEGYRIILDNIKKFPTFPNKNERGRDIFLCRVLYQ